MVNMIAHWDPEAWEAAQLVKCWDMRCETAQHWGSSHGQMLGAQQLVSLAFLVSSRPVSGLMSDSSAIIPVIRYTIAVHNGSEAEAP